MAMARAVKRPKRMLGTKLETARMEKPIVMGHSMGTASAAWFAAKYPNVPRAVVLEDPRLVPRAAGDPRMSPDAAAQQRRHAHILQRIVNGIGDGGNGRQDG